MSDLLGPLLGMSPYIGVGQAQQSAFEFHSLLAAQWVPPHDLSQALNALAPPLPEPGIHWTRTGGKSWRVVIVR